MSENTSLSELMQKLSEEIKAHKEKFIWQDDIQWPIEVSGVQFKGGLHSQGNEKLEIGSLVSVRLCDGTEGTHLGMYLGEFPIQILFEFNNETNGIELMAHRNPAILVPKLHRIVWGAQSWWGKIESEEDLKQITDEDIQNVWYVKAFKQALANNAKKDER